MTTSTPAISPKEVINFTGEERSFKKVSRSLPKCCRDFTYDYYSSTSKIEEDPDDYYDNHGLVIRFTF